MFIHSYNLIYSNVLILNPILPGTKRNQETILKEAAYDHGKKRSNMISGPKNKSVHPGRIYILPVINISH